MSPRQETLSEKSFCGLLGRGGRRAGWGIWSGWCSKQSQLAVKFCVLYLLSPSAIPALFPALPCFCSSPFTGPLVWWCSSLASPLPVVGLLVPHPSTSQSSGHHHRAHLQEADLHNICLRLPPCGSSLLLEPARNFWVLAPRSCAPLYLPAGQQGKASKVPKAKKKKNLRRHSLLDASCALARSHGWAPP